MTTATEPPEHERDKWLNVAHDTDMWHP